MAGFDIGRAAMFWKSSTMVPGGYLQFCLTPMLLHEWTEPTFWLGCCHSLWMVENTFFCDMWMSRKSYWMIWKYQITRSWRNVCCHGIWSCWTLRQVTPGNTWEMLVLQAWWTEPRWAPVKSHCAQVGCIGIRKLRRGSWGLRGADLLERSLSENEHGKSFRYSFHVFHVFRFHSWLTSNSYQFIFASQLVISFFHFWVDEMVESMETQKGWSWCIPSPQPEGCSRQLWIRNVRVDRLGLGEV